MCRAKLLQPPGKLARRGCCYIVVLGRGGRKQAPKQPQPWVWQLTRMTALVAPEEPLAFSRWGIWRDMVNDCLSAWGYVVGGRVKVEGYSMQVSMWADIRRLGATQGRHSGIHFHLWRFLVLSRLGVSPEIRIWGHVSQLWSWLGQTILVCALIPRSRQARSCLMEPKTARGPSGR